jgi:hypothetical protein
MKILTFLCTHIVFFANTLLALEYKSFDESFSCTDPTSTPCNFIFRHKDSQQTYDFYKSLFENFNVPKSEHSLIPKKIHYAWLGGKKMPKIYKEYIESCRIKNKGWEITVWDETSLSKEFQEDMTFLDRLKELKVSLAYHKDFYLFKVLNKHGGIFLDVDYLCIDSFDEMSKKFTNFFVLEPPTYMTKIAFLNSSLIGSTVNNELLQYIYINWREYFFDKAYMTHINEYLDRGISLEIPIAANAQLAMGFSIIEYCKKHDCERVIVFPPTYFNPIFLNDYNHGTNAMKKLLLKDKIKFLFFDTVPYYPFNKLYPETIAAQDWHEHMNLNHLNESMAAK